MADAGKHSLPFDLRAVPVQSFTDIIGGIDRRVRLGDVQEFTAIPTGFDELDLAIGGGFRQGQLVLLSGPAGVGKTSFAMQLARNIASSQQAVCLFACYEHETDHLAQRLISMESVSTDDGAPGDGLRIRDIAELVRAEPDYPREQQQQQGRQNHPGFLAAVGQDPRGARALERISHYGHQLLFIKRSSYTTTVQTLAGAVEHMRAPGAVAEGRPVVHFVDYLQKIAAATPHTQEEARNVEAIEGLKEMALGQNVVVLSIVAAQVEGLKARRMRLENLLASAELAYEADIIMVMNDKFDVVDRQHIEYNRYNAQLYHQFVILSLEKNRMGSDLIDLEMRKQLQFCRFRPTAERVKEKLITGRARE
jgi:replicative DNA helicase